MLAYSTVSQLGYMFLAMGVGAYAAGIFHLMTHAFFKACLFLGSGSVIHAMHDEQDMRKMGGLRTLHAGHVLDLPDRDRSRSPASRRSPASSRRTRSSGRRSRARTAARLLWLVGVAGAGLTAFYMFRQVFLIFFGECRADHHIAEHVHESPRGDDGAARASSPPARCSVGFLGVPAALGGGNRFAALARAGVRARGHAPAHARARTTPRSSGR